MTNRHAQSAPAVPLFVAFAVGIALTVEGMLASAYQAATGVLVLAAAVLDRMHLLPRRLPWQWLVWLLAGSLLASYQAALHRFWLTALPESDGVWEGYLLAVEHGTDEIEWRLQLSALRGSPQLRLYPSSFGEAPADETWQELTPGTHALVTGTLRHAIPSGNPGEFNALTYQLRQGIAGTVYVRELQITRERPPLPWQVRTILRSLLRSVRRWIEVRVSQNASGQAASVLVGMLTGNRAFLAEETEDVFRRTGISHLLSVSGFHVSLIAGVSLVVASLLGFKQRFRLAFSLLWVWVFVAVAGGRPSALRAGIMASLGTVAYALNRRVDPLHFWALAGIILLCMNPLWLYDVGWQLSFAATGSILLWLRVWRPVFETARRWYSGVLLLCGISAAAQLGTAILVVYYFNELSVAGIVVNWIVVPLAGPVLALGAVGVLLSALWAPAGGMLIRLAGLLVEGALPLLGWIAEQPWSAVELAAPGPATAVGWGLFAIGLPLCFQQGAPRMNSWGRRACVLAAFLFAFAAWEPIVQEYRQVVYITFLDVGQGDSILIRTPRGRAVLVDGGGRPRPRDDANFVNIGRQRIVPYLRRLGIRTLDLVVNTHPDEDHIQGLVAVLEDRRVNMVIDSGRSVNSVSYAEYREAIDSQSIPYSVVRRGDVVRIDDHLILHVLNPGRNQPNRVSINNDSVVLRVETPHGSVLLTGDLERSGQQELLWGGEKVTVSADVMKVPHHGSGRDVDWRFIDAVAPSVAVIQVGRNTHGHPSPETVAAYADRGATVYRTDRDGAVEIALTPRGLRVRTHRNSYPYRGDFR